MSHQTELRQLDPKAKQLLDEAGVGETLQGFIARVTPSEDQVTIARALHKKDGIDRASLQSALSSKGSAGHRRRIIDRCRAIVEED